MPLTGTYTRNLDDKNRLAIPKRLADEFGEAGLKSFYVAPGTKKSLSLYSPLAFEKLAQKIEARAPSQASQDYLRMFYSGAERVDVDGQGRIRIPERLVAYAGLQRDVLLLGVHDHAEIWDATAWQNFLNTVSPAFDELAEKAFQ